MPGPLVFVLNVAVLALLAVAFFAFQWSGPGFALGFGVGFVTFHAIHRIRSGAWL